MEELSLRIDDPSLWFGNVFHGNEIQNEMSTYGSLKLRNTEIQNKIKQCLKTLTSL